MPSASVPLHIGALLGITTVVLYVVMEHAALARALQNEAAHRWLVAWCAASVPVLLARIVQRGATDPDVFLFAARAQYSFSVLFFPLAVFGIRAVTGRPIAPRRKAYVFAVAVVLCVLGVATPMFVAKTDELGVDLLGARFVHTHAEISIPAFAIAVVVVAVACLRTTAKAPPDAGPSRAGFLFLITAFAVLGLNDTLVSAGVYRGFLAFEWGVLGLAVGASRVLLKRVGTLQRGLESAVAARTSELESALLGLKRSEARFQTLAAATAEGVLVHEDGRVIDANDVAARLFSRSAASLAGQRVTALFEPNAKLKDAIDGGQTGAFELRGLRDDGSPFPTEVVARTASVDGRTVGTLAVRDLTDRKALEERLLLADRMASIGTLAVGAAHEINNPLAYVKLNVEMVAEELGDPARDVADAKRLLAEALEGCGRVEQVVRDLGAFTLPTDEELSAVDVGRAALSALKMIEGEIGQAARLVRELEPAPRVHALENRIVQMILNLVLNAIHAIPKGDRAEDHEITIAVRGEGDRVILEVRDTGQGMTPEVQRRAFDPFFTTKPIGAGAGLGLFMCHNIVSSLGGEILISSEVGRGTRVRVSMPALPAADPSIPAAPISVRAPKESARILLVDDEPALARSLSRVLRPHRVVVVSDGREALEMLEKEVFDVILLDVMMPVVTGIDVYEAVRAKDPKLARRVIFMTGGAFTEKARDFLASVENACFDKPLDARRLRRLIDELANEDASSEAP